MVETETSSLLDPALPALGRIGIVTGSGPEAGLDLWAKILLANRARTGQRFRGDIDVPAMLIVSEPRLGLSMDLRKFDAVVWSAMETTVQSLAPKIDTFCIACNTLHFYEPQVRAMTYGHKLISIIDVAEEVIGRLDSRPVALLGSRTVMSFDQWSPYTRLSRSVPIETADPSWVEEIVFEVKRFGAAAPRVLGEWRRLLSSLRSDVVLLACTELPLLPGSFPNKRLVDLTNELAVAVVARAHAHASTTHSVKM